MAKNKRNLLERNQTFVFLTILKLSCELNFWLKLQVQNLKSMASRKVILPFLLEKKRTNLIKAAQLAKQQNNFCSKWKKNTRIRPSFSVLWIRLRLLWVARENREKNKSGPCNRKPLTLAHTHTHTRYQINCSLLCKVFTFSLSAEV